MFNNKEKNYSGPIQFLSIIVVFFSVYYITGNALVGGVSSTFAWILVVVIYNAIAKRRRGWAQIGPRDFLEVFRWWP